MNNITMECFIMKDGVECKAGLEDLFPLITDRERAMFQYFLRRVMNSKSDFAVNLAAALAFLSDEIKEMVYRNVSVRNSGRLKKDIKYYESEHEENHSYFREQKEKLIDFLGKLETDKDGWFRLLPQYVIWKETKPRYEDETVKPSHLESFIKCIDEALDSGELEISYYDENITQNDIRNVFANRVNDLHKIRQLEIKGKDLSAAALLFEKGKIEKLKITDEFDGEWPPFMENCLSLTSLGLSIGSSSKLQLTELPSWIRNVSSLRGLSISYSEITSLPDWIGDLQSLTKLTLYNNKYLETLPDSIGSLINLDALCIYFSPIKSFPDSMRNLKNLQILVLKYSPMKKLPDWIGDLQSLTTLLLDGNEEMETLPDSIGSLKNLDRFKIEHLPMQKLPDSIGNLKNLKLLCIYKTPIQELPDWIGNLQSLTGLSLNYNDKLKTLPDSIGNLKNLTCLDLRYLPIERLPDSIVNCTALESVDIIGTNITSVPDFIKSIKFFKYNTLSEIIPQGPSISYRCFCNSYYKLAKIILWFNDKARREGLLSLEEELEYLSEGFFKLGIRLVVDGTDAEIIRDILQIKLEREDNFYRKKLMEAAMEGILSIQAGDSPRITVFLLASLVNIENNLLEAACAKYLCGDTDAIDNIDFYAAIQDEGEREEIRFIKRAIMLIEIRHREGFLDLEELLDHEGIAARDVFEYGLVLVIDDFDAVVIARILDNLIARETDPVRKNFAQAKKAAVLSINDGDHPRLLLERLCAYFDDEIAEEAKQNYNNDYVD